MRSLKQGDIVIADFNPSRGHEAQKLRPSVVVSSDDFNKFSSMTLVCPIVSRSNAYPLHIEFNSGDMWGSICLEQMRSFDLKARKAKVVGQIDDDTLDTVLAHIRPMFGI